MSSIALEFFFFSFLFCGAANYFDCRIGEGSGVMVLEVRFRFVKM